MASSARYARTLMPRAAARAANRSRVSESIFTVVSAMPIVCTHEYLREYPAGFLRFRRVGSQISWSALVTQINRLEEDLGQPLFERAERGRAMKLTRFGKRVAAAAQTIPAEEMPRR
ncbi:LysR family transcriptional regulator [Streptomyces sp. JNUCC 63]